MKKNRSILIILIVFFFNFFCSDSNIKKIKVKKGQFNIKVHAIGSLKSTSTTYIGCPSIRRLWSYTISYMATEGKKVKKGDKVIAFDPKNLMEKLQESELKLETVKKELEKSILVEREKKSDIELKLIEATVIAGKADRKTQQTENLVALNELKKLRLDFELSKLDQDLKKSELQSQIAGMKTRIYLLQNKKKRLSNRVDELKRDIKRMNIKAPKSGIIVYKKNWSGKKKAVGDRCWFGENIVELPDLSKMEVAIVIPESNAGKIKNNLPVEIRLDSNPDRIFKGKIESIGRIFRSKSKEQPSIVFDAIASIEEPDSELMRPGMAAGVDIIISSKRDVIQIPEKAVIYHEKGIFVWKKTLFGKEMVQVIIGEQSGNMVEVIKGLEKDETILIVKKGNGEKK